MSRVTLDEARDNMSRANTQVHLAEHAVRKADDDAAIAKRMLWEARKAQKAAEHLLIETEVYEMGGWPAPKGNHDS